MYTWMDSLLRKDTPESFISPEKIKDHNLPHVSHVCKTSYK